MWMKAFQRKVVFRISVSYSWRRRIWSWFIFFITSEGRWSRIWQVLESRTFEEIKPGRHSSGWKAFRSSEPQTELWSWNTWRTFKEVQMFGGFCSSLSSFCFFWWPFYFSYVPVTWHFSPVSPIIISHSLHSDPPTLALSWTLRSGSEAAVLGWTMASFSDLSASVLWGGHVSGCPLWLRRDSGWHTGPPDPLQALSRTWPPGTHWDQNQIHWWHACRDLGMLGLKIWERRDPEKQNRRPTKETRSVCDSNSRKIHPVSDRRSAQSEPSLWPLKAGIWCRPISQYRVCIMARWKQILSRSTWSTCMKTIFVGLG